jgi:beta-xylosidase
MRRLLAFVTVLGVLLLALDAALPNATASRVQPLRYSNPVFRKPFPDPMVLRLGRHDYWAYGTSVTWEVGYFPILHSSDLVHWRYAGDAFKSFPSWSSGDFWAPDVVKRGRTYYFYYVGRGTLGHCIGVATASAARGPFKPRNVIGCGDANGLGWIDPDLYIGPDGEAYLYVSVDGPPHSIAVIPMQHDLIHKAGASQRLFGVSQSWEENEGLSTVEGPFLIRHNDLYYLFYSGNVWRGKYAMGYATSSTPTGPFTKYSGNPVLRGNAHVRGPGGGSVVEGPDGNLWMVYHAWGGPEGLSYPDTRNMRIDPLVWNNGVVSVPVHPG